MSQHLLFKGKRSYDISESMRGSEGNFNGQTVTIVVGIRNEKIRFPILELSQGRNMLTIRRHASHLSQDTTVARGRTKTSSARF